MRVKKLQKPITLLIEIRTKSWRDKPYGNSYESGRLVVNRDYKNEIVQPISYGHGYAEQKLYKELYKRYPSIAKRMTGLYGSELLDAGVLVTVDSEVTTKARCKRFGDR